MLEEIIRWIATDSDEVNRILNDRYTVENKEKIIFACEILNNPINKYRLKSAYLAKRRSD